MQTIEDLNANHILNCPCNFCVGAFTIKIGDVYEREDILHVIIVLYMCRGERKVGWKRSGGCSIERITQHPFRVVAVGPGIEGQMRSVNMSGTEESNLLNHGTIWKKIG